MTVLAATTPKGKRIMRYPELVAGETSAQVKEA